ncbi:coiled-coil domain-containing protein 80 [Anoplopoma fimbria]|uniref:coiled-coil domain-containing protein 80 n=1 Tax=Anoplopoma fimbria TaxID=229290 RepID=UPI0023EB4637|nr:coiled-coil domain-containing protein 80 [Anoplopoma fimbria]
MFHSCKSHWPLLLFAALWSYPGLLTAWPGISRSKPKDQLDPNVRDWGDYSDLPPGMEHGLGLDEDHADNRGVGGSSLSLDPELDFLADFAGKKRLWVITAPSHNDHYLRMMEKQLEDMEQKGLNCRLAERDTFIITIIQNAMMEGRIQKTTFQGEATVESLDPDTVSKLLHYLELTSQEQGFTMLVLKKNLRVSERFPYPVRVEAILELIDQFPVRKLEKMTRKGSNLRCKTTKKKVVMKRKKIKKKMILSPQRRSNVTSVVALQRKPPMDKKAALKSKIQDILSGRSRFVIRKVPSAGSTMRKDSTSGGRKSSNGQERVHSPPSVSKSIEEVKKDRPDSAVEEERRRNVGKNSEDKKEQNVKDDTQEKQRSKKKGKGKKGKKGRGKKSNREASEKDKTALKEFLDTFKGTRRLMLISTPSRDAKLFMQQKDDSEKQHCDLAFRKITMATIVGEGSDATLTLQHHQLESEPPLSDQSEHFSDSGLISLLRTELGLSSSDLFSMTVTDYDIKPNKVFEAPPSGPALFEYIDNFPSRRSEKEKERRSPPSCSNGKQKPGAENTLLRFMSKRRLLLISAPSEDDYFFQQQISALNGQECHLGIRHFAILRLTGTGDKASGTVELFPLNGHSQSEVEPLSGDMVNNLREQLKISKDYFSMLVVGKDSDVKAWFPSPMWSLDSIYDLVDSMELRLQEEKLQKRLGIHCPEDRGTGGNEGGHYPGYDEDGADEPYLYHRSEE